MAKQKPDLTDPWARTEPIRARRRRDKSNPVSSMGVGLRASEWMRLQEISDELGGVGLHPLLQWVIRDFVRRYDAGEVKPPTETKAVLK